MVLLIIGSRAQRMLMWVISLRHLPNPAVAVQAVHHAVVAAASSAASLRSEGARESLRGLGAGSGHTRAHAAAGGAANTAVAVCCVSCKQQTMRKTHERIYYYKGIHSRGSHHAQSHPSRVQLLTSTNSCPILIVRVLLRICVGFKCRRLVTA